MILITGATGHIGGAVLNKLLALTPAANLAAFVRDPAKATHLKEQGVDIRVGNYADFASLDRALDGVSTVLLVSGGGHEGAIQEHFNVIDAAKRAQVSCFAYTGRSLADRTSLHNQLMERHFQTEDYIIASGLPYLLFRNALYMDTLPIFTGPHVRTSGIRLPAAEGRVAFTLRSDLGQGIAIALQTQVNSPDKQSKVYTLTSPNTYSFYDVAEVLSIQYGEQITYEPVDEATFRAGMESRNVPSASIEYTLKFMRDIAAGQETITSPDLTNLLGKVPNDLATGLKELYT
jgi:NAD(P)H dehydrogenase (quinone)